jgi:DNA-binding HxlR family transcriptional regulator
MQAMTTSVAADAPRVPPPAPDPTVEAEVQQAFREFREASVRLAERIGDLHGVDPDPVQTAREDLHIVRTIFGKWCTDVLVALHAVPSVGFEELRRSLPGISPRVLSLKLKELEQNGMVHREIINARPPRVRYALTDRGWTVAWLAQPVLIYLRVSDAQYRGSRSAAATRGAADSPE